MSQQKPAKKAESTVVKPMAKKDRFKNLGGEIGNPHDYRARALAIGDTEA
mgnify:CR=1 FL=1